MAYFYDNKDITNKSFIIGQTRYATDFLPASTLEQREALGIIWVDDPIPEPYIPPVPTSVTMGQARAQLIELGLLSAVNAAVATMSERAQSDWEYRATVDRDNTLTQQMIAFLGWTAEQTDEYFTAANLL